MQVNYNASFSTADKLIVNTKRSFTVTDGMFDGRPIH